MDVVGYCAWGGGLCRSGCRDDMAPSQWQWELSLVELYVETIIIIPMEIFPSLQFPSYILDLIVTRFDHLYVK